ncbi:MAG: alpha/beta fold hydrolase [Gammaproteobacteria bacterium]|jgi:enterochelin esterase-like enzyme
MFRSSVLGLLVCAAGMGVAVAQHSGTVERITVHGASLEGNLEGNDPNRTVTVYLPPSYESEGQRRYPVVYFLHGFGMTSARMADFLELQTAVDSAIGNGVREMIVVIPDAYTKYSGSMYSSSPTIGDWESFVADDLVEYVDAHYRTIPERRARGLSGHSMGGYGTMRIGMKRPEPFGALYAMSSCCLMNQPPTQERILEQIAERGDAPSEVAFANVMSALAAAWAPNPNRPPRYFDWPYEDGKALPLVAAKWATNSPLVMVDQYVANLNRYEAIFLDVGDADGLSADNRRLDEALSRLGVEHEFELYEGDHVNRVAARFRQKLLPFFSATLEFE